MPYLKKPMDADTMDTLRINLSVRDMKLSAEPVCDICGDSAPVWCYASKVMSTGKKEECWRWCACDICSELIDNHQFHKVSRRAEKRVKKMLDRKGISFSYELIQKSVEKPMNDLTTNLIEI